MSIEIKSEHRELDDGSQVMDITFPSQIVRFTADELSLHIEALARMRSEMSPEIRRDLIIGERLHQQPDPAFFTQPEPMTNGSSLYLRHSGLGWMAYHLPYANLAKLHELLGNQIELAKQGPGRSN